MILIAISSLLILSMYWICKLTKHDMWMEKYHHDWVKFVVCLMITVVSVLGGYAIGVGF